jgi:predicted nuclease of predicted toxin-antitoxin system
VRLLFDEHLSPRLVRRLDDLFPGSSHVQLLGLRGATDRELWSRAREGGFVLVTRDADFQSLSMELGPPPKVVVVRLLAGGAELVDALLRSRADALRRFEAADDAAVLILEG